MLGNINCSQSVIEGIDFETRSSVIEGRSWYWSDMGDTTTTSHLSEPYRLSLIALFFPESPIKISESSKSAK